MLNLLTPLRPASGTAKHAPRFTAVTEQMLMARASQLKRPSLGLQGPQLIYYHDCVESKRGEADSLAWPSGPPLLIAIETMYSHYLVQLLF